MLSKILPIVVFCLVAGIFLSTPQKAQAGWINIQGCGTAANCESPYCSGNTCTAPSGGSAWKFYCNGYHIQCGNPPTGASPYAQSGPAGSVTLDSPGCDKTVQMDVFPSSSASGSTIGYKVWYTGSCTGPSGGTGQVCVFRFQQPVGQNGVPDIDPSANVISGDPWADPYANSGLYGGVKSGQGIRLGALRAPLGTLEGVSADFRMRLQCVSGPCAGFNNLYSQAGNDARVGIIGPIGPGVYSATYAQGTSTDSCTTASSSLVVYDTLACTVGVYPSTTLTNQTVNFTGYVTGASGNTTSYSWSGTDSLSGTNQTVSKSYTTTGNKTATLNTSSGGRSTSCSNPTRIVSGTISPSPNPCTITSGTTCNSTITWSALNTVNTYLYERRSGSAACSGTLFSSAVASGSQARAVDTTGYVYDLCTDGSAGFLLIASTPNVTGVYPPFDYSLANSGSLTVPQGTSGNVTVSATLIQGQTQTVTLDGGSGWPANLGLSYNPASRQCTPTAASCTQITITPNTSTPIGSNTITVTGSPLNKTTQFVLNVTAPISPWIRTTGGDVHSNSGISTTTGQ